jgi:protein-tyrosine-phosphatase
MHNILFLCPHGGAKSVIASSYFKRLAEEQALPCAAIAAAAEEPYDAVPPPVAAFLEEEGFDVRAYTPRRVQPEDVRLAARVVSIDCDLSNVEVSEAGLERWDDVPMASVDLDASVAAIRRHVEELVAELHGRR